jgi:hypothetical protein
VSEISVPRALGGNGARTRARLAMYRSSTNGTPQVVTSQFLVVTYHRYHSWCINCQILSAPLERECVPRPHCHPIHFQSVSCLWASNVATLTFKAFFAGQVLVIYLINSSQLLCHSQFLCSFQCALTCSLSSSRKVGNLTHIAQYHLHHSRLPSCLRQLFV